MNAAQVTHTPGWTTPYCGIQHKHGKSGYWVSVEEHETFVQLSKWIPGRGFNAINEDYSSLSAAREAGDKWLMEVA